MTFSYTGIHWQPMVCVYTLTYIENICTFCNVIAVHNLHVMHVMPIAIFHVMPSLWHVMHNLHVINFLFEECLDWTQKGNGLSILLRPCGAVRHCGAVPHYVFQGCSPKKTMIPYCCVAVGLWIANHFSQILVLARASGFNRSPAITAFATAPIVFLELQR